MFGILDRWKISCGNVSILEFIITIFVIITIIIIIIIAVTDFKVDAVNWPGTSEEVFSSPSEENCPTRTSGLAFLSSRLHSHPHPCPHPQSHLGSVLALSVVCALLLVIYICTMFYFCMRKVRTNTSSSSCHYQVISAFYSLSPPR